MKDWGLGADAVLIYCCLGVHVGPTIEEERGGCEVAILGGDVQQRGATGGLLPFPRTGCVPNAEGIVTQRVGC